MLKKSWDRKFSNDGRGAYMPAATQDIDPIDETAIPMKNLEHADTEMTVNNPFSSNYHSLQPASANLDYDSDEEIAHSEYQQV